MDIAPEAWTAVQDGETVAATTVAGNQPPTEPKLAIGLKKWGELAQPEPPNWVVSQLILAGALNTVGGEPGVGKSRIAAHLAVSVAAGYPFLGFEAVQRPVLVLNFDDPSASLYHRWYHAAAGGHGLYGEDVKNLPSYYVDIAQLGENGLRAFAGLNDKEVLRAVAEMVKQVTQHEGRAPLVIIDAYASAFPTTDNNNGNAVMAANERLQELQKLGVTIVMLDHTPKSLTGQPDHRGVSGSQQKKARARTQHIIRKGTETYQDDQDIVVWTVDKNNAAKVPPPFAIRREYDEEAGSDVMTLINTPRSTGSPKEDAAYQCIVDALKEAVSWMTRKELVKAVKDKVGASERTVESALNQVLKNEPVEEQVLAGSGSPKAFRFIPQPETPPHIDLSWNPMFDAIDVAENISCLREQDFFGLDATTPDSLEDDVETIGGIAF